MIEPEASAGVTAGSAIPRAHRDPAGEWLNVVHAAGLAALVTGMVMLRSTEIGADPAAALAAAAGQLATTLPAALMVGAASLLNLLAGAVVVRLLAGEPFPSLGLATVAGLAGAVLLDGLLLAVLGSAGLFDWPLLLVANAVLVAFGLVRRPLIAPGWRLRSLDGAAPFAAVLIGVVWAGPLLVQLASPVVPFLDVLPNHVAPVEHLRVFDGLASLDRTPSPIYGPSRIFLGYEALLGAIVGIADLPAVSAVGAFALPLAVLVALAGRGLARAVAGPRAGVWALVLLPLSVTFLRIADARAGVVAFPLVALALWLTIDGFGAGRRRRALVLGLTLTVTMLVHPLLGLLAAASLGLVAVLRPAAHGWTLAPVASAPLVALPQWLAMLGLELAPWVALPALAPGAALMWATCGRVPWRGPSAAGARPFLVAGALLLVVAVVVAVALVVPGGMGPAVAGAGGLVEWYVALLAAALLSLAFARNLPGWYVPWAPVVICALAGAAVSVVPTGSQLGDALRFELPKTLTYLGPTCLAVAGAIGLAALWQREDRSLVIRAVVGTLVVVLAAAPIRAGVVHPLSLGEHRLSESLSVSLRYAERGYWSGFPDVRRLVDEPRAELIGVLRAEIQAGRLRRDTEVLHVARSFQPWVAAPLAVFAGVVETTATLDPEKSIHTVGGRLESVAELPVLLGRMYGYVVLEPEGLEPGLAEAIEDAGFRAIFSNSRGTVFVREAMGLSEARSNGARIGRWMRASVGCSSGCPRRCSSNRTGRSRRRTPPPPISIAVSDGS